MLKHGVQNMRILWTRVPAEEIENRRVTELSSVQVTNHASVEEHSTNFLLCCLT